MPAGLSFQRAFLRPLSLALVGCLAVGVVLGWHAGDDASADPAYAAIVKAHTRRAAELTRTADSLAALATSAETIYVATRREAHALVASLPRVETAGDTIVLTEGRFLAPHAVVALVGRQAHTIAVQDSALTLADQTIAAKDRVIDADSRLLIEKDTIIAVQQGALVAAHRAERWRTVREWGTRAIIAATAYTVGRAIR